jgi:hypothetical protein
MNPWFPGQLRNYLGVFIPSLVLTILSALWAIFLIDFPPENPENTQCDLLSAGETTPNQPSTSCLGRIPALSQTFSALTKPRARNGRAKLILLILAFTVTGIQGQHQSKILFQFVQNCFNWNATQFSFAQSVNMGIPAIFLIIIPRILKNLFNMTDSTVAIFALVCQTFGGLIRGSIINVKYKQSLHPINYNHNHRSK